MCRCSSRSENRTKRNGDQARDHRDGNRDNKHRLIGFLHGGADNIAGRDQGAIIRHGVQANAACHHHSGHVVQRIAAGNIGVDQGRNGGDQRIQAAGRGTAHKGQQVRAHEADQIGIDGGAAAPFHHRLEERGDGDQRADAAHGAEVDHRLKSAQAALFPDIDPLLGAEFLKAQDRAAHNADPERRRQHQLEHIVGNQHNDDGDQGDPYGGKRFPKILRIRGHLIPGFEYATGLSPFSRLIGHINGIAQENDQAVDHAGNQAGTGGDLQKALYMAAQFLHRREDFH